MPEEPPTFSNYPRYLPHTSGQDIRPPGIYLDTIRDAWGIVSQDLGTWIASVMIASVLGTLIFIVLIVLVLQVIPIAEVGNSLLPDISLPREIAVTVLSVPVYAAWSAMTASLVAMGVRQVNGESISVGRLFDGFRRYGSFVVLFSIYMLFGILVDTVLYLYPALRLNAVFYIFIGLLYIGAFVFLSPYVAFLGPRLLLTDLSLGQAIRSVYQQSARHTAAVCALMIVLTIIMTGAFLLCGVPLLFAIPLSMTVIGMHYRYFFPEQQEVMVPPMPIGEAPPQ